jgi:hypothetical protein
MTAPGDVTVDITESGTHQARCRKCGWRGEERWERDRADKDRRVHLNGHILAELAPKIRRRPS